MIYLLDTNVISETVKPSPNPKVLAWLNDIPNHNLALSVLTLGEIRKGAEKHTDPRKKAKIIKWLEIDLVKWFENRIISIDMRVADKWGHLCGSSPQPLPAIDCLLAATALCHNLTLVTRNTKDFTSIPGLELFNPWD